MMTNCMTSSKYIVIVGPDGCGKTSVADKLAEAQRSESLVRRMNFSFGILPSISTILQRVPKEALPEGQKNAGMVEPLHPLKASILAIWYGIDHLLGVFVLRKNIGSVTIFARSYHDFIYQRAYKRLPRFIPAIFLALGPKPDLVVLPLRDAKSIHDMKPELTKTEIMEQYARVSRQFGRLAYFNEIDGTPGIESVVSEIQLTVFGEKC